MQGDVQALREGSWWDCLSTVQFVFCGRGECSTERRKNPWLADKNRAVQQRRRSVAERPADERAAVQVAAVGELLEDGRDEVRGDVLRPEGHGGRVQSVAPRSRLINHVA